MGSEWNESKAKKNEIESNFMEPKDSGGEKFSSEASSWFGEKLTKSRAICIRPNSASISRLLSQSVGLPVDRS